MFGSDKKKLFEQRKDTERSLISETVSIEGSVNSSGAIDIAGLIKGPVYSNEVVIKETGSVSGAIEADKVEIHGHLDGKVSSTNVVIGSSGVVKGDIEFANNLRTEDGADIEGYIRKSAEAGIKENKSAGDFLFSKSSKDDKKTKKSIRPANGHKDKDKDTEALV
jgi:cytoskeletal protein CcmA (bactofilin family)|tara:strand:+ start:240 stop:734 length:495 start_codon:yes stop_codon:yes gene_type:complete